VDENLTLTAAQGSRDLFRQPTSGIIGNILDCNSCVCCKSMTLEEKLELWIEAYCCEPSPHPRRVAELNAIFREIYNDRRFWRYRNVENRCYYEDALSKMWLYFWNNLCETTTAKTRGSFLETRTYAIGRLLTNLKGNLRNINIQMQKDLTSQEHPRINGDGVVKDPISELPNPEPNLALRQFKEFLNLLEEDPMGELQDPVNTLCGTKKPYELTAQTYLLMRYRDDKTIQQIADELDIPYGTLQGQGSGKPARWKALARKYAEMAINNLEEDNDDVQ
jgi:hypothetical protein